MKPLFDRDFFAFLLTAIQEERRAIAFVSSSFNVQCCSKQTLKETPAHIPQAAAAAAALSAATPAAPSAQAAAAAAEQAAAALPRAAQSATQAETAAATGRAAAAAGAAGADVAMCLLLQVSGAKPRCSAEPVAVGVVSNPKGSNVSL